MVHLWHDIPAGTAEELHVIIEIPEGSRIKYEVDKDTGILKVDRIIPSSVAYPGNYGFIPQTLGDDGDPIDVLILSRMSFTPGVMLTVRPIGGVAMLDDGKQDEKIICVMTQDKLYANVTSLDDVTEAAKAEIEEFFRVYKRLEATKVEVNHRLGTKEAKVIIEKSMQAYAQKFGK